VDIPVSVIDVAPTALELLGLPTGAEMQGRSLVPLLDDSAAAELAPILLESWNTRLQFGWAPLRALREERWKFIQAPRPELYDLEADPGELVNLAQRRPEVVRRLERAIEALAADLTSPTLTRSAAGSVSDDTRSKLEALGYVSHGSAASAEKVPSRDELRAMVNPRDRVEVVRFFNTVVQHLRLERTEDAVVVARRALEHDPDNGTMHRLLGDGLYRLAQYEQALQAYREACRLRPRAARPRIGAAAIHHRMGDIESEIEELLVAHSLDPTSARTLLYLAAAHISIDRGAEAIEFLEQAAALDSESWVVHRQLGRAFARLRRFNEAKEAFETSLTLNPGEPSIRLSYGVLLRQAGDLVAARKMLRSAADIAPDAPVTHLELAEVLVQLGDVEEAEYHVEWVLELAPESELALRARLLLADGS
jgi:Flp pilus assembly protein TadD